MVRARGGWPRVAPGTHGVWRGVLRRARAGGAAGSKVHAHARDAHNPPPPPPGARYLNGALVYRQSAEEGFPSPNKPMHFLASIWSDAARGFQFGGVLDYGKSPFFSTLASVVQVACDAPMGDYNGPNWLHAPGAPAGGGGGGGVVRAAQVPEGAAAGGGAPEPPTSAYLGCFDASKLKLGFARGVQLRPGSVPRCAEHCAALTMPVYALNRALKCVCSAGTPDAAAQIEEAACSDAGPARSAIAVPVFYLHALPGGEAACRVQGGGAGAGALAAAYNKANLELSPAADAATLKLTAAAEGVRVASAEPQLYGMVSFKARVSDEPGVITAAYVSRAARASGAGQRAAGVPPPYPLLPAFARTALHSQRPRPRPRRSCARTATTQAAPSFRKSVRAAACLRRGAAPRACPPPPRTRARAPAGDRPSLLSAPPSRNTHLPCPPADILFLNGAPADEPGTLWLNSYKDGRSQWEARLPPSNYTRLLAEGAPPLAQGAHAFTIDWQPTHVAWCAAAARVRAHAWRQRRAPGLEAPRRAPSAQPPPPGRPRARAHPRAPCPQVPGREAAVPPAAVADV